MTMNRALTRRVAVLAVLGSASVVSVAGAQITTSIYEESAAYAEGATPLRFNPASINSRYPSELAFSVLDFHTGDDVYVGAIESKGVRLAMGGAANDHLSFAFGAGGGKDSFRHGVQTGWLPKSGGGRTTDWRYGFQSRPIPWLSLGGVADHVTRPTLGPEGPLERAYTLAVGIRPLAMEPKSAHTLGTRLTLTADASVAENQHLDDTRFRLGAELEIAQGLAVRGAWDDRQHDLRVGVSLRGVKSALHATQTYDKEGDRLGTVWTGATHEAEDRTVFASRTERRVGVIRVGGTLGDDALSGVSIDGATTTTPVGAIHKELEAALDDPLTRGVLLDVRDVANLAQIEELRPRIDRLRAAGKPVVAYLEYGGGRGDLYLASSCDRVVATPEALYMGLGMMVEHRYYRKFLDDLGLRIDRASYGVYKSAYRKWSVDSTTGPDRESTEHLLDAHQELFVSAVTASRHMDRDRLLGILDGRLWRSEDLAASGLIDTVGYGEDALKLAGRLAKLGSKPRTIRMSKRTEARAEWTLPGRIAVVYAAGSINPGPSGNDVLLGPFMGSSTLSRQIESAFKAREVKAVVLRIESGGGSSLASDLIYSSILRAKHETHKPLVVSMGRAAASGGYHIALPGDRLFADRFTLTGSIGVLYVRPSLEGFFKKHDIKEQDSVRGPYMRGWSIGHDWDKQLQAIADSSVRREYRGFVTLVANARKLPWDDAERAAQGRVWMGDDARRLGLVDEIGGLEQAIAEAKRRGGVPQEEKIRLVEYRRPRGTWLMRTAGSLVRESLGSLLRMPEARGGVMEWADEIEAWE
jgi:protease-4